MGKDINETGMKYLTEHDKEEQVASGTKMENKYQFAAYDAYEFDAEMFPEEFGFCQSIVKRDKLHSMAIKGKQAEHVVDVLTHRGLENAKRMGVQEMQAQLAAEAKRYE